ncbi:MAG: hypothetical protein NXI17_06065 [Alphaproteobacteria bacterium]|nr:hypothetical protein [Alphaproteobacteria bacterium]
MKILSEHSSFEKFKALWKQIYRFFCSACQAVFIFIWQYPLFSAISKTILLTVHRSGHATMLSHTPLNSRRFGIFETEFESRFETFSFCLCRIYRATQNQPIQGVWPGISTNTPKIATVFLDQKTGHIDDKKQPKDDISFGKQTKLATTRLFASGKVFMTGASVQPKRAPSCGQAALPEAAKLAIALAGTTAPIAV